MRAIVFIIPTFILMITSSSCQKRNTDFNLGEKVTIPFGKTATLNDNGNKLKFKFTDLIEESRCPPGGTCIWMGRVIVELEIDDSEKFELGIGDLSSATESPILNTVNYWDYLISLESATFKRDWHYDKKNKYSIEIKVEK